MHPRQWRVRRRSSADSGEKQQIGELRAGSSNSSSSDHRSSRSSSDNYSTDIRSLDSRSSTDSRSCQPASIAHALDSLATTIHRSPAGLILAGTLHGLVRELITDADVRSCSLHQLDLFTAIFYIYTDFTTPERIIQSIERHISDADALAAPDRLTLKSNAFRLLRRWVENSQVSPGGPILDRMSALARRVLALPDSRSLQDQVDTAANAIELRRATLAVRFREGASSPHNGSGDSVGRVPSVNSGQANVKPLRASEVTPEELAISLTLTEGERYRSIKPADYIRYLKQRPASTASSSSSLGDPNRKQRGVQAMSSLNNDIIHWVKFSVLDPEEVGARASAMLFFINTAEECRRLRNFSSATAIANALQSSPIERLRYTRQRIPAGAQHTFDELVALLDPSSNHRAYRAALRQTHDRPTLPWLAVHLRDLNASLERYPQAISVTSDGDALLNVERISRAAACMNELLPDPTTLADRRPLQESPHAPAIAYLRRELRHSARTRSSEELLERAQILSEAEERAHRARARELEGLGFRIK